MLTLSSIIQLSQRGTQPHYSFSTREHVLQPSRPRAEDHVQSTRPGVYRVWVPELGVFEYQEVYGPPAP